MLQFNIIEIFIILLGVLYSLGFLFFRLNISTNHVFRFGSGLLCGSLSLTDGEGSAWLACCVGSSCLTSSPSFLSCQGASSAVILRSRVELLQLVLVATRLRYNGFKLGDIVLYLAVCSSYWAMMQGILSRALTKLVHSKINYFGQREIALTNKNYLCF